MALARYWKKNPPVHLLVAAYIGWKAPEEPEFTSKRLSEAVASPENENAALALIQALAGGG